MSCLHQNPLILTKIDAKSVYYVCRDCGWTEVYKKQDPRVQYISWYKDNEDCRVELPEDLFLM